MTADGPWDHSSQQIRLCKAEITLLLDTVFIACRLSPMNTTTDTAAEIARINAEARALGRKKRLAIRASRSVVRG
jgi:hypothetical protein